MPKAKPVYFSGIEAARAQYVGMHHAATGNLQPASFQRATHEGHVNFGGRLGEREKGRPEAHLQVIGLEEAAQKIGNHALEVGEANVLAHPQPLDLVEHRRMRRIRINAIDTAGTDHAQLGHRLKMLVALGMRQHGANLHRAGVSA